MLAVPSIPPGSPTAPRPPGVATVREVSLALSLNVIHIIVSTAGSHSLFMLLRVLSYLCQLDRFL